jgi:hypothetical protein
MLAAQAPGLPSRDAQSVAYAQLAIWSLLLDNGPEAASMAQKAVEKVTPATAGGVALARFLAAPSLTPEAWQARAQHFFPDPGGAGMRDVALGYAFLLTRQFAAAVPVLRREYERAGASPESSAGVDLGWALAETGASQEAAALLRTNPVPAATGPNLLLPLWFPQLFHARAVAAERSGKAEEARMNREIFEKLAH